MTFAQNQPAAEDNERFINESLAFGEDQWVCHDELKDAYDEWIMTNLGRTRGSSPGHRNILHAQILGHGDVTHEVRGYSDYVDGRKERLHFLGVGLNGQTGTSFQRRA